MESDCDSVVSRKFLVQVLYVVLAIGFVLAAHAEEGSNTTIRAKPTAGFFGRIFKELRSLAYPPDDYFKVFQERIPKSVPHPCETNPEELRWRSEDRPTSVHKLRPGDIDVIAAMGDSLTTASAAREMYAVGVSIQDRGVSLSGGGLGTWREITTLANIIKIFNPNLVGYARGRGDFLSTNAQLNVAFPAALDDDLLIQVKLFMKKMKSDLRIDFTNDWKLITIFIGHNDLCSYHCIDREKHSARNHKLNLQKGLDYLYKYVPRVFVNIISLLDPTIGARVPSTIMCDIYRRIFCACLFRTRNYRENKARISAEVRKYQEAEEELASSGRYEGREDFSVTFQPFAAFLNGPTKVGEPEYPSIVKLIKERPRIWSSDCFHLNQRGQASASILLWNNMLEPVANKSRTLDEITFDEYKCPNKENPYFFTKKNSEIFYKEGHQ